MADVSQIRNNGTKAYVGRFAPSPSGPLHFGSLVGALASYCDAHHCNGRWLVRMEDLDPPREQAGAADAILRTLEQHGLHWHGDVLYQSQRAKAYRESLELLEKKHLLYPCFCSRKHLREFGSVYPGFCRELNLATDRKLKKEAAIRLKLPLTESEQVRFDDIFLGWQNFSLCRDVGDYIVRRKDGLYAYQLAVVVDDDHQGITHVIRGSDLLDSTPAQIYLQRCLNVSTPRYGHIPVATNDQAQKLSKQHGAAPVNIRNARQNLRRCLEFLHQHPPADLVDGPVSEIIDWAVSHWDRDRIPKMLGMPVDSDNRLANKPG